MRTNACACCVHSAEIAQTRTACTRITRNAYLRVEVVGEYVPNHSPSFAQFMHDVRALRAVCAKGDTCKISAKCLPSRAARTHITCNTFFRVGVMGEHVSNHSTLLTQFMRDVHVRNTQFRITRKVMQDVRTRTARTQNAQDAFFRKGVMHGYMSHASPPFT